MDNGSCCPTTIAKKEGSCGTMGGGKPNCAGIIIRGVFAGGIVMFLYLLASWMVLPWHMSAMHGFKDEKAVAKILAANAPQSGIYVLPYAADKTKPPAVDKPFAFVNIKAEGFDCIRNFKLMFCQEFLLCLILAGLLTCLLKNQNCGCPVGYSMKLGLLLALAHNIPDMIWWHYPVSFSLVNMADDFLAVTLTGIAISKCVLKNSMSDCAPKGSCG